jgi:hypothetical protein
VKKLVYNNEDAFSNNVNFFFCDELTNQNSKVVTSVNDRSEKHWNKNINLIEDIKNQNTNFRRNLFLLGLKSKTKQCTKFKAYMNNNVIATFDRK